MNRRGPSLAARLARFAADPGPLPRAVVETTQRHWARSVTAAEVRSAKPQTNVAERAFASDDPGDIAFCDAVAVFAESAATLDPVGHTVRTVIVPALQVCGGATLALAVAAEVTCRLFTAVQPALTARRTPVYPVLGPLGAAVAVARAGGGLETEIANALAVAGSLACGVAEIADVESGAYLAGWSARSGLLAGQLGLGGFTGPAEALEGTRGLFAAFTGDCHSSDTTILDRLGAEWRLLDVL